MTNLDENKKVDSTVLNQTYYHEQYTDNNDNKKLYTIEHLIMAKEGTEAGNYYNQSAINFLSTNTTTTTKLNKYPVKATIKNYLIKMSGDFFESSIPKENIKIGEVTINNLEDYREIIENIVERPINFKIVDYKNIYGYEFQKMVINNFCFF